MQDTPPCARVLEQEQLSWPKDQQHPAGRRGQRRKDVSREGKSASSGEPPELARKGREPGEVGGLQKKRQTEAIQTRWWDEQVLLRVGT